MGSLRTLCVALGFACGPALAQINNWSDFQRACAARGMEAVKGSGGVSAYCKPASTGVGAATAAPISSQQMGVQILQTVIQGMLAPSQGANDGEQERLRREELQARKIEEQRREIKRLEQEAKDQDDARTRVLTNMRSAGSATSVAPAGSGLRLRSGEASGSALEQLQRAAGSGNDAVSTRSAELASVRASAVFDNPTATSRAGAAAPATPRSSVQQQRAELKADREKLQGEIQELKKDPSPTAEKLAQIEKKNEELKVVEHKERTLLDLSFDGPDAGSPTADIGR